MVEIREIESKRTEWTTGNGLQVAVVSQLTHDGKGLIITDDVYLAGKLEGSHILPVLQAGPVVASCGRLGISKANMDRINAAHEQLKQHPEYVAEQAVIARAEALRNEHKASQRKLDAVMTGNGRSY